MLYFIIIPKYIHKKQSFIFLLFQYKNDKIFDLNVTDKDIKLVYVFLVSKHSI